MTNCSSKDFIFHSEWNSTDQYTHTRSSNCAHSIFGGNEPATTRDQSDKPSKRWRHIQLQSLDLGGSVRDWAKTGQYWGKELFFGDQDNPQRTRRKSQILPYLSSYQDIPIIWSFRSLLASKIVEDHFPFLSIVIDCWKICPFIFRSVKYVTVILIT